MKKETVEKIFIAIVLIVIVLLFRATIGKESTKAGIPRTNTDQLINQKIDSLENIISFYHIQDPDWELEIDANCKKFAKDFEKEVSEDSLTKVVIVGITNGNGSLKWIIRAKED